MKITIDAPRYGIVIERRLHVLMKHMHPEDDYNPCDWCSLKGVCARFMDSQGDDVRLCELSGRNDMYFQELEG